MPLPSVATTRVVKARRIKAARTRTRLLTITTGSGNNLLNSLTMANQYLVTRIKKPGGSDSSTDHIEQVFVQLIPSVNTIQKLGAFDAAAQGFVNSIIEQPCWMKVEDVIKGIESGSQQYYTDREGSKVIIEVNQRQTLVDGRWIMGRKFIQTKADFTKKDNLLSLPNDYGK